MLRGRTAMPAWADAQLPESIASKTPRQSLGTTTLAVVTGGAGGWVGIDPMAETTGDWTGPPRIAAGCGGKVGVFARPACGGAGVGSGASGSGAGCATMGAAQIMAPNASSPDFKLRPPSAATSPSMPVTCLRVD